MDMSPAGLKSRRTCSAPESNTGHVPCRDEIPLGMFLGGGQGWAYWHYVHCWGPTLGMPRLENGSRRAQEYTFRGVRESCRTCPAAEANTGRVPCRAEIPQDMFLGAGQGWAYWHYVHCWGPTLGTSRLGRCRHA